MTIRTTAGFTHNPTRARFAGRNWSFGLVAAFVKTRRSPRFYKRGHEALLAAAEAIRRGQIVAVKGLGGFHLIVAARDEPAVRRLRERKHREEKPFALMFPSLESVKAECEVSPLEERLLRSPEAPIVLLQKNRKSQIANRKFGGFQATLTSA